MITIPIDPTNPGHIFAAIGLTELAFRITGDAKGYFDKLTYKLVLNENLSIGDLVSRIKQLELTPENLSDKDTPISLGNLRLDWWLRPAAKDSKAGNLKTWAGNMNIGSIAHAAMTYLNDTESLLFDHSLAYLPRKKVSTALTSLDSQKSRSTLDTGYSPNDLGLKIISAPSVEFLAIVGLQRAWPFKVENSHAYYTWSSPLPPVLIPAALIGRIERQNGYKFSIVQDGNVSRVQPAQPFSQH